MIRSLLVNPRRVVKTLLGRDFFLHVDNTVKHERFGSEYGGWNVVTDGICSESIIYSFGIGHDASFDVELIKRFGVTVHAFDPTPGSIDWVEQSRLPEKFILHRYGLAATDGIVTFYTPENPDHISHSMLQGPSTGTTSIKVPVKCLKTIMSELGHRSIDILKMDIEGAEYQVLEDVLTSEIRPHQILVEFHHRFATGGIENTRHALGRLKAAGYRLFSVSPTVEEFCFIR